MPIGYKEAFGLSDNPFGPRRKVGTLPPNLTAELEKRPLLLHRHGDLEKLYCNKIPSFRTACENLDTLLEADGYVTDPPGGGVASYLVAIEGDRGAGKTTLASRMLQLMLKRYPEGEPAQGVEEVLLKSSAETVTEQIGKLKALEANVGAAKAAYRCVLIDDLLADAYPHAAALYDNLRDASPVFMVFTSCDPKMAEQIDKTLHNVQRFNIAPLTPDDAIAYVNARYQIFRIPSSNGLNEEPLFPFDEKDIRKAVAVRVMSGATTTGPVNLRLVASVLQSALVNRLQEIARQNPGFDVHAVPAGNLTGLKIEVAQAYRIVVRK
ncbi:MAG TPA: ATP-binding protein [Gammaproteobacteria bacterium]|nr:ATP-binding protein [Gammaproteobacteria bacterium]